MHPPYIKTPCVFLLASVLTGCGGYDIHSRDWLSYAPTFADATKVQSCGPFRRGQGLC